MFLQTGTVTNGSANAGVAFSYNGVFIGTTDYNIPVWILGDGENPYKYENAIYYSQAYGYHDDSSDVICVYFRANPPFTGNRSARCWLMAFGR